MSGGYLGQPLTLLPACVAAQRMTGIPKLTEVRQCGTDRANQRAFVPTVPFESLLVVLQGAGYGRVRQGNEGQQVTL